MANAFSALLKAATTDERVMGVIVGGSRGKGFETAVSDWDVYVITLNDADPMSVAMDLVPIDAEGRIDLCGVLTVEDFARHAMPGDPNEWNRYNFAHLTPSLDRTDGLLQQLCDEKEWLDEAFAHARARALLDAYLNSYYRALKNARDGNHTGSRLDATESVPRLLELVFTAERRARPYNKYLAWELDRHPVDSEWWTVPNPVAAVSAVASGNLEAQAALFHGVERRASALDLGDVLDAWGAWSLNAMRAGNARV